MHTFDFGSNTMHSFCINTIALMWTESLATEFEQDTLIRQGWSLLRHVFLYSHARLCPYLPSSKRLKRRITMFSPVSAITLRTISPMTTDSSLTQGCNIKTCSLRLFFTLLVMTSSRLLAGTRSIDGSSATVLRNCSVTSAGTSSRLIYLGAGCAPAIWSVSSLASLRKLSLCATKSVLQLSSNRTPTLWLW